jgi:hypothetical protein
VTAYTDAVAPSGVAHNGWAEVADGRIVATASGSHRGRGLESPFPAHLRCGTVVPGLVTDLIARNVALRVVAVPG